MTLVPYSMGFGFLLAHGHWEHWTESRQWQKLIATRNPKKVSFSDCSTEFFFIDGNDKEQLLVRELQVVPNGMAEEVRFLCDFLSHRVQLNKQ